MKPITHKELPREKEKISLSEADIITLLKAQYQKHLCIDHLRMGIGFTNKGRILLPDKPHGNPDCERSIDLFTFAPLPSQGFARTAFEIKISASDFSRELTDPIKRRAALRFSNKFYFVAPIGIISLENVPPECGLIEISQYNALMRTIEAPWHDNAPNWAFLASVIRRMDRENADLRKEIECAK